MYFKLNLRAGSALTAVTALWLPATGELGVVRGPGRGRGPVGGGEGSRVPAGTGRRFERPLHLRSPLPSPALAAAAGAGSALCAAAPAGADRAHLTPLPAALALLTGRQKPLAAGTAGAGAGAGSGPHGVPGAKPDAPPRHPRGQAASPRPSAGSLRRDQPRSRPLPSPRGPAGT